MPRRNPPMPGTPRPVLKGGNNKSTIGYVGNCAVCKLGIFSGDEWGRAPLPLLGKAHKSPCGGV